MRYKVGLKASQKVGVGRIPSNVKIKGCKDTGTKLMWDTRCCKGTSGLGDGVHIGYRSR